MVIGLCGFKNAGKDSVASHLIKRWQFERKAFADPLKRSVAALFDIPFRDIEKMKNDPDCLVTVTSTQSATALSTQTFREMLQRYGTESHRGTFGKDFWVDQTLPQQVYTGRRLVITDVRFTNEAVRVNEVGGFVVCVNRPYVDLNDLHPSEVEFRGFRYDYVLENDGTLDELWPKIDKMLEVLGER